MSAFCTPQPHAILFGLLAQGDSASVLVAGTPQTLTQAPLPSRLRAGGTLAAYALLEALPAQLLVRSATGAVLENVDLSAQDRDAAEYCAAFAEGQGPS